MADTGRKEENTMPVELAIMRELEYRRIVAAFHLRPDDNSNEKVKSSNDASHPKSFSSPISLKFSSLLGIKRKESPTRSTLHPLLQHQQPFHGIPNHKVRTRASDFSLNVKSSNSASRLKPLPSSSSSKISSLSSTKGKESQTKSAHHLCLQPYHGNLNYEAKMDDLYCTICKISCPSPFNLKQHLKGQRHKKMLQKARGNHMQWCEVCNIPCMNEDLLKLHLQGQKHKAKLQMLEISKQGGEAPNKPKWCELCKVRCTDEFAFGLHLEGKKHIIQLHTTRKEEERSITKKMKGAMTY